MIFSNRSLKKIADLEEPLQLVLIEAIKNCPIDFGISEGHRTLIKQQEYYRDGKSKCDGIIKKSKHQFLPSEAFDIYAYVDGSANYGIKNLTFIAGWIMGVADQMGIEIEWGGHWKHFNDMPHFQIKK